MAQRFEHDPVLAQEVARWLGPGLGRRGTLVDCTVGGGGHSLVLLQAHPEIRCVGIDRDDEALRAAGTGLAPFAERVRLIHGNFADLTELIRPDDGEIKSVLYDLGVSSPQLDRSDRGFKFRSGDPLDMRMDRKDATTAKDIVNGYSEEQLAKVLSRYGEERFARRIARSIVKSRASAPITTGDELAEIVTRAIPAATRRTGPHPARRTFQALRIEVNKELDALQRSLPAALDLLAAGGRIAVISYHSLEDRIVKRTFVEAARGCTCPSDFPVCVCGKEARARILTKRPIRPTDEEIARNPRSDSARLRVAEKMGEAA